MLILLFSIKGVTALDFLFVPATAFATADAARLRRVIISAGVATAATGLAYATILHMEFENILLAAQFQENNLSVRLGAFLDNGLQFALYNPAIPNGRVASDDRENHIFKTSHRTPARLLD